MLCLNLCSNLVSMFESKSNSESVSSRIEIGKFAARVAKRRHRRANFHLI